MPIDYEVLLTKYIEHVHSCGENPCISGPDYYVFNDPDFTEEEQDELIQIHNEIVPNGNDN